MSDGTQKSWSHSLESISKIGVLLIGIVYMIGFMVVAIYLGQYNVSAVSLVRAQYIVAGIWLLLPLLLSLLFVVWIFSCVHDEYREVKERPQGFFKTIYFHTSKILKSITIAFGWALMGFGVISWSLKALVELSVLPFLTNLGIIILFAFAIAALAAISWMFLRDVSHPVSGSVNDLVWGITFASFCAMACVGYVGFFGLRVYGGIPSSLGGGKPLQVRFILKPDVPVAQIPVLVPEAKEHPIFSRPLPLLTASEKTYVVLDSSDKPIVIEFSRDLVLGILILRDSITEQAGGTNRERDAEAGSQ